MNALEELKAPDEQRAKILTKAKLAALQKAEDAIAELSGFGFHYRLIESARPETAKGRRFERSHADAADKSHAKTESPFSGFDQSLPGS